jgi:type IV pilus biogenesis/stability protein PilW
MKRLLSSIIVLLVMSGCASNSTKTQSKTIANKNPDKYVSTMIQIAYEHLRRGKFPEARHALSRAIDEDDSHWGIYLGLAKVNEGELEDKEAIKNYKKAMELGGGTEAEYHYGAYLFNHGEFDKSCATFANVVENKNYERRSSAFHSLAQCEEKRGNTAKSIEHLNKAAVLDSNNYVARIALAQHYFNVKDFYLGWQNYVVYLELVQQNMAKYSASNVLLGTRLAAMNRQFNTRDHLVNILETQFGNSREAKEYFSSSTVTLEEK